MVLVKHVYILNSKNQTGIFLELKIFYENTYKSYVWVYMKLSNPPTNLSFTFYLKINLNTYKPKHKSSENLLLKIFFFYLTWSKPWSNELDSSWVLDAILMRELLNQHVLASKFDFESFVEAKHRLRSRSNIWNYINTRSLVL